MIAEPLEVRIIPAREESLARINDLIARSKSYSNWPADYLKKALPLHEIEPSYLRRNQCFELLDMNDQLAAFLAVAVSDTRVVLDNLWVRPDLIGKGVGRQACEQAGQDRCGRSLRDRSMMTSAKRAATASSSCTSTTSSTSSRWT